MEYRNFKHKVWLVGRTGRVGQALETILNRESKELQVIGTDIEDVDITKLKEVEKFVESFRPDTIINCASKRDKNWCEENELDAYKINAIGARNLAIASFSKKKHLIHISTDYIFDGNTESGYRENDKACPNTVYGKTMKMGEDFIRDLMNRFTIVRCSGLYGKRLLKEIINNASSNGSVNIFKDKVFNPISTLTLAEIILDFLDGEQYGVFHLGSEDKCTHKEFVEEILKIAKLDTDITEDKTVEYAVPDNLVLEPFMLKLLDYDNMPLWKEDLSRFIKERKVV